MLTRYFSRTARALLALFGLLSTALVLAGVAEPLQPEQAFRFSALRTGPQTIEARWDIAEGYYLYRDRFKFAVEAPARLETPRFPAGESHEDENFGKVEIYRRHLVIALPLAAAGGGEVRLQATFQGCADVGVCYPPQTQSIALAAIGQDAAAPGGPLLTGAATGNESARIAGLLSRGRLWVALATFFGFGLLLCLTPCVLPMVPILSGIIVNHGHAVSHGRAFALSLAYVLGMAFTYTLAGVAAGLSGTLLSSALQNAWVLGGFALVFVALSLSMFGFYELQLPSALQSRLSDRANRQGGSLGAIALMGALSALIVGPCVAAPLAGALLYIAKTRDALLGGAALFALALGMGAPLLAVGLFSRSLLPKTGPWMEAIKKFFGVILLATALWLVSPVLPVWAVMAGSAVLMIVPAVYLRALDPLPPHAKGWSKFWKGVGIVLLLVGIAMLAGALGGARNPLRPLDFLKADNTDHSLRFEPVRSVAELEARLASANRPVMLDFYADWCVSCKEMEREAFADPRVKAQLDAWLLLQADVTANTDADRALLARFGLYGPPGILFFDRRGQEIQAHRIVGYQDADTFLASMRSLAP